jgi:geranylgeranyl reductase family protein
VPCRIPRVDADLLGVAHFDLIIVGAGPAGSNAASVALDAGLRVAQLDAAAFPRVKPCAGGVTLKAVGALRSPLDASACQSFREIEFNLWGRRRNRFAHPLVLLRTVCRPDFDNRLVQTNLLRRNFTFMDRHRVLDVAYDGHFVVRTSAGSVTGRQLIGADGAYSAVNRLFKIAAPRALATAVEINIPRTGRETLQNGVPALDFGAVPQGYGWVFPKRDHWSVGLYTLSRRTPNIREALTGYLRAKGLLSGDRLPAGMEAFRIPFGGFRLRPPACPVYVTGDAGGFADALTGEGIYAALESGRLAGEVAVDVACGRGGHQAYYRRLWRTVLGDTALSYVVAKQFYRDLDRGMTWLEHPLAWRALIEGTARGATFAESISKSAGFVVRSWARSMPGLGPAARRLGTAAWPGPSLAHANAAMLQASL